MTDNAHRLTDVLIEKIEKHINVVYENLEASVENIMIEWIKTIESQADDVFSKIQLTLTDNDRQSAKNKYNDFLRDEIINNSKFNKILNAITDLIYATNFDVSKYINSYIPEIYVLNFNYINSKLNNDIDGFSDLQISNQDVENYGNLDEQTISKAKDIAWNKKNITKSILIGGGMLLSIKSIMRRTAKITARKNHNSANLHNRDMATYAENIARLDGMFRAQDMGFDIRKQWRATLDNRTRDSHARLDGTTIKLSEKFDNKLMYPRDPSGVPSEICNCRCHLQYVLPKYTKKTTRTAREGTVTGFVRKSKSFTGTKTIEIANMSYREWMKWKGRRYGS